jgi:hypothetical protein
MMIKCEICEREFMAFVGLSNHITQRHKNEITIEDYYLKFIGEKGKCKTCGKDTKFNTLGRGYSMFCSSICSVNDFEVLEKRKQTRLKNNNNKIQPELTKEKYPDLIRCKICEKDFINICSLGKHIVRTHKIKIEDYYLIYIGEEGKCKTCGETATFKNLRDGYSTFCSCKCSAVNPETRLKSINTCIEKYDCENVFQSKEVKEKSIQTCLKKHGVDNYSKTEEFKIKSEITCLKNHGVKHAYQNKEIRKKGEETCLKNHGVRYPSQNKEIRNRQNETCFKNHGVRYAIQNKEIRKKSEETYFKKHGVRNPSQNPDVIDKILESTLNNNNGVHPCKLTYKKCLERYPDVVKIEELKEGANGEILAHCKNSSCKNSKENGGYFEVTSGQINWRNDGINGHDTNHFYCCEECKHTCPLYGRSATRLHNLLNENSEIPYTQEEYLTWKEEVYYRQKVENNTETNFCEYCHATEDLHVHHEVPQKIVPGYALDPDNGIIACEKCHYEKGHATGTECSTGNLANKICK